MSLAIYESSALVRVNEAEFWIGAVNSLEWKGMVCAIFLVLLVQMLLNLIHQMLLNRILQPIRKLAPRFFSPVRESRDACTQTDSPFFGQEGYQRLEHRRFFVTPSLGKIHLAVDCCGMNLCSDKVAVSQKPLHFCGHCLRDFY